MIEIILNYAAIWLPSIVAMGGIVYTVLTTISKVVKALESFRKTDDINELRNIVQEQCQRQGIQQEQLDIIIDELAKIKGYRESRG